MDTASVVRDKTHEPWEKVLYKRQAFPDNYVGPDFLSQLQNNLYIRTYHAGALIISAGSLYQQFCCISVFLASYFYLLFEWSSPFRLGTVLSILITLGYGLFNCFRDWSMRSKENLLRELRIGLIIFTFGLMLAPILHTLLITVSTDTIYALTFLFLLINWVCFDYSGHSVVDDSGEAIAELGANTIAQSSGLLAALCLASRLANPYATFALFLTGVGIFSLWPSLAHAIRRRGGKRGQLGLTIYCGMVSQIAVWPVVAMPETPLEYQIQAVVIMLLSLIGLNFLGPWLLLRMQRIKKKGSTTQLCFTVIADRQRYASYAH